MNILVTGASGQLGMEFQSISSSYPDYSFSFATLDELDITNQEDVEDFVRINKIDLIINCAGYTDVDQAEEDIVECDKVNHFGVSTLATVAEAHNIGLIIFSTNYIFDGTRTVPYTEEDATSVESKYAITKLAGERVALAKCSRTMVIRTSWLYSSLGENSLLIKCLNALKENRSIRMCYDRVGSPTYSFDLATFVMSIIQRGEFQIGIFNYANEGICSMYDFAKMIQCLTKLDGEIYPISTLEAEEKAYRPPYGILDKNKVKQTFNITIPYWVDSLEGCIRRINENN